MNKKINQLQTLKDTFDLGCELARMIGDKPMLIFLQGDLGAGKTTLAQSLINSLMGTSLNIPSPTYAYVQRYEHDITIYHLDLYRIESIDDIVELGLSEIIEDDRAIRIIEWPERLGEHFLSPDIAVELVKIDSKRQAIIEFSAGYSSSP